MKRKHTRIIALIIVIAVVVTTVMSTVLAFADETDTDYDDSSYSDYEDPDDYEDSGDDWEDDWDDYDITKKYDFSNVQLKQTSVVICSQDSSATVNVGLRGLPQMEDGDSDYIDISDVTSSNPDMTVEVWRSWYSDDSVDSLSFDVSGVGETTVTFTFCGKPLQIRIRLIQAWIDKTDFTISKGKTCQIVINGDIQGIKPVYKSLEPSVASVSASGKVKAKKNGAAVIKVSLGDSDAMGAVVNVAPAKKIKAFNWARSYAAKNTYSQDKRMEKGYFDCSSLVWRAYHSQGINMMQKNWAPTAADLGKYLVGKHKKVASADWKNYEKLKFQVGDLLFETGEKNGRYKGIYHVEMFGGYTFYGFDSDGQPQLGIQFARNGGSEDPSDFLCRP